jgi:Tfp pilus assembly protein PilV
MQTFVRILMPPWRLAILGLLVILCWSQALAARQSSKQQWKTLPFAIVRYNDDAPKSWNVYRGDRKGIYLVRLWKRYLLIDTDSQNAFEIDPEKVKAEGDKAELAAADIPADPLETSEWKTNIAGPVLRHRFRFGKSGNFMELQIPVLPNGRPAY